MKLKHLLMMTFLFLIYQYNVYFWFLFTHCRKYFFLWGIYLFYTKRKELNFFFPHNFAGKFASYSIILILLTVTSFYQGDFEPFALKLLLSFIVNIFAALPIVYLLIKWSFDKCRISIFRNAMMILLFAIAANNTIAVTKLVLPSLYDFLMSLQVTDASMGENVTKFDAYRIGGWGENLTFIGGTSSAFGIVIAMYMYCNAFSKKRRLLYLGLMLYVLFSGILISRTTMIGLPLAGFILLHYIKGMKSFIKYLFAGCAFAGCAIGVFFLIINRIDEHMASWAFEMVLNFVDSGEVSGESYNDLKGMWQIIPTNISTWLVGDGRLTRQGGGYYMATDVGLLRIIFFIGTIGLLTIMALFRYFSYNKKMLVEIRMVENVFFIWVIVMNIKGIFFPVHLACLLFVLNNTRLTEDYNHNLIR